MFDWDLWRSWEEWIAQPIILNFVLVLGIVILSYFALRILMSSIIARVTHWLTHRKGRLSHYGIEVFKHTSRLLIAAMALQIGLDVVDLGPVWEDRVSHLSSQPFMVFGAGAAVWSVGGRRYCVMERRNHQ